MFVGLFFIKVSVKGFLQQPEYIVNPMLLVACVEQPYEYVFYTCPVSYKFPALKATIGLTLLN